MCTDLWGYLLAISWWCVLHHGGLSDLLSLLRGAASVLNFG